MSAEGRLKRQKRNQTAALLAAVCLSFGCQLDLLEKNLITLTRVTFKYKDICFHSTRQKFCQPLTLRTLAPRPKRTT